MNKLNKLAMVGAKIIEILHWLIVGGSVLIVALSFIRPEFMNELLQRLTAEIAGNPSMYGEIINKKYITSELTLNWTFLTLIGIIGICYGSLMAMVGRNINLIFKTMEGRNKHSESTSPFQEDIVRMVREIGIFYIAIPFVNIMVLYIGNFMLGPEFFEPSLELGQIITGVIILCLSQVFAYGVTLQKEVEDLV